MINMNVVHLYSQYFQDVQHILNYNLHDIYESCMMYTLIEHNILMLVRLEKRIKSK